MRRGAEEAAGPEGHPEADASTLKKQCKQQYDQLKADVMQFLIQAQWVQQEAEKQDVKVTDAEVKKSFEDQKKQAFPKPADYKKFLASSGMTEKDILFRVRLDQLQTKLTQKVTEGKKKVTDEDIKEYYEKNKKRFAQPERRDLNVVLTKTKAKAEQAKAELEGGASFKAVSKKYSIDEASKAQGGKLPDVSKGQQEKALDTAVFVAKKGKVEGPGQDPVRLLRLPGHEDHQGLAADPQAGDGHDPQPAQEPGPAEVARQVHQGLPRVVQEGHELREGLRGRRVQERAEVEDRHGCGLRRRAGWRQQAPQGAAPQARGSAAGRGPAGRTADAAAGSRADSLGLRWRTPGVPRRR